MIKEWIDSFTFRSFGHLVSSIFFNISGKNKSFSLIILQRNRHISIAGFAFPF